MTVITPEYITVKETAEAWGVTKRWVNMCIEDRRVSGAMRMGNMWLVPKGAEKPAGERREKKQSPDKSLSSDLAYVIEATTKYIPRDNPDIILDANVVGEGWLRLYCEGALAYFRGDYEKVIQCFRKIGGEAAVKLAYCPLAIAATISTGNYPLYQEIETFCKDLIKADIGANVTAVAELALTDAYVGAYAPNMIPDWLKAGDFTALPTSLRPNAFCKRARYLHFIKKYESVLDVARTALAFDEPELGISYSSFYLRIMCAASYCSLDRMDDAEKYLLEAMNICLPHGFIVNFAELALLLSGLLERLLKREFPAYYDAVFGLSERIIRNWISFHNRFTRDNITMILSRRDGEIALLAAQGVPNKKIAERFCMSEGALKNRMGIIYQMLFISGKKELPKYVF